MKQQAISLENRTLGNGRALQIAPKGLLLEAGAEGARVHFHERRGSCAVRNTWPRP